MAITSLNTFLSSSLDCTGNTDLKTKSVSEKSDEEKQKLKKACQDMKAVFLNMLLKEMRTTVPKSKLFAVNPAMKK